MLPPPPTEISPPHTENSRVKYTLCVLFRVEIYYLTGFIHTGTLTKISKLK